MPWRRVRKTTVTVFSQESAGKYAPAKAFSTRAGMRAMRLDTGTKAIYGMTADNTVNPSK